MFELIRANRRKAMVLVVLMAALMLAAGYSVAEIVEPGAGVAGLFLAFGVWVVLTLVSYFQGDRILLATSGARRIQKEDHPILWNIVEEMCIASGLATMPEVYIIDQDAPNAFATGRDPEHSAVAVTSGLLERLTRDELQGVVAHELGHINNRDILYLTVAGIMMGTVVLLADLGTRYLWFGGGRRRTSSDDGKAHAILMVVAIALAILAPILAQLLYFALSRRREYLADASAAVYTRYPSGLADALEKIAADPTKLPAANRVTAPMYIINPLKVSAGGHANLTSTHPPTSKRIEILRSLAGGQLSLGTYDQSFRKVTGRAVGVFPPGSLEAARAVEPRAPQSDGRDHVERVRETTDAMWRLQGYAFIPCACGTSLKVPPAHRGTTIACPHCGAEHAVPVG